MSVLELPTRHTDPGGRRSAPVVGWVGQVLAWTVIVGFLAVLVGAVLVPRIAGATPYTVLTGSMTPSLPPGTLVVVKPAEPDDIGIGTVITYQLRSGEPQVVTHRVVEVRTNLDGQTEWHTQGDANSSPDQDWVRPEQVRGALWYSVPHLGRLNAILSGEQRQLAVYGVAGALIVYAGAAFLSAARGHRRGRPLR